MKSSKQNLMLDVCTDMEYLVCLFSPSLELSTRWVSAFSHRLSASLIFEYLCLLNRESRNERVSKLHECHTLCQPLGLVFTL